MSRASHGDGRRMTLAEAIERRARMIRVHGSLVDAHDHGDRMATRMGRERPSPVDDGIRDWNSWFCHAWCDPEDNCLEASDVGLLDGIPVAMCPRCRAARREQPGTFEVETLEDLAFDFMEAVERPIGGSP